MADTNLLSQPDQKPQQPIVTPITPKSIPAGTIRQRHLQAGYVMVKVGKASERPASTNEVVLWLSIDTFVLSCFDPITKTWKSTTLS